MGLFECPECKNQISDKAKSCPHCGYPLPETTPDEFSQTTVIEKIKYILETYKITPTHIAFIISGIICICTIVNICISSSSSPTDSKTTKYKSQITSTVSPTLKPTPRATAVPTPKPTLKPTTIPTQPPATSQPNTTNKNANTSEVKKTANGKTILQKGYSYTFNKFKISYEGYKLSTDYEGKNVIIVDFGFTNLVSDPRSFSWTVSVKLFQDGIQLEDSYFATGYESSPSLTELQQGASLTVPKAFVLRNKTSPIDVEITDWAGLGNQEANAVIQLQ